MLPEGVVLISRMRANSSEQAHGVAHGGSPRKGLRQNGLCFCEVWCRKAEGEVGELKEEEEEQEHNTLGEGDAERKGLAEESLEMQQSARMDGVRHPSDGSWQ